METKKCSERDETIVTKLMNQTTLPNKIAKKRKKGKKKITNKRMKISRPESNGFF